jgi:hypothetical protein
MKKHQHKLEYARKDYFFERCSNNGNYGKVALYDVLACSCGQIKRRYAGTAEERIRITEARKKYAGKDLAFLDDVVRETIA